MSNVMTAEGLEKLKDQLSEIKQKLKEVAVRIKDAKDLGDLSENAEYHEAKNEQAFLYGRAVEIEEKIKMAIVADKGKNSFISVGSSIGIENEGEKITYSIVGSSESDPSNGKISIDSPIGSAVSGHRAGDTVTVSTPAGEMEYKILEVN